MLLPLTSAQAWTCYFWQPDQVVEEIDMSDQDMTHRPLLDGIHQLFLIKGSGWGMAAGYSMIESGDHMASAKSQSQVSFRNYNPNFSVS